EFEIGIAWREEGLDDGSRFIVPEQGLETHVAHTLDEDLCVSHIAGAARWNTALLCMFPKRLMERDQRMSRRGEAELAVGLEAFPLIVKIEHDGMALAQA